MSKSRWSQEKGAIFSNWWWEHVFWLARHSNDTKFAVAELESWVTWSCPNCSSSIPRIIATENWLSMIVFDIILCTVYCSDLSVCTNCVECNDVHSQTSWRSLKRWRSFSLHETFSWWCEGNLIKWKYQQCC